MEFIGSAEVRLQPVCPFAQRCRTCISAFHGRGTRRPSASRSARHCCGSSGTGISKPSAGSFFQLPRFHRSRMPAKLKAICIGSRRWPRACPAGVQIGTSLQRPGSRTKAMSDDAAPLHESMVQVGKLGTSQDIPRVSQLPMCTIIVVFFVSQVGIHPSVFY